MSEINVVPYIDVMLVLLVIFMITAPLLTQGVKIDLPDAPAAVVEAADTEPLIVSVDAQGRYFINFGGDEAEPVDEETLLNRAAALLRHQPGIQVLVKGDESVDYGSVVAAMAVSQGSGRSFGRFVDGASPPPRWLRTVVRAILDRAGPYALAFLVHAAAAVLLVFTLDWPVASRPSGEVVESVEATVVDEARVREEILNIRARETARRREEEDRMEAARQQREHEESRLKEVRQRRQVEEDESRQAAERLRREREALVAERNRAEEARLAEEKLRAEAQAARVAEEKRRKEVEAARLAEEKRREEAKAARLAEEKRRSEAEARTRQAERERREEAEKARRQRELAMARQRAEEERVAARAREREEEERRQQEERARRELMARERQRLEQDRQAIFAKALEEYSAAVRASVEERWQRPTGVPRGLRCTVRVEQADNGEVRNVQIIQSSGDVAFDRSVERAVLAASPLPLPKQRAVFEREIVFRFSPRG